MALGEFLHLSPLLHLRDGKGRKSLGDGSVSKEQGFEGGSSK